MKKIVKLKIMLLQCYEYLKQIPTLLIIISCLLLAIAFIDYNYFLIPLSLSAILLVNIVGYIYLQNENDYLYYLYGMIIGFGYLLFILLFTWIFTKKQPLGFGDLVLILILGLWLGAIKVLLTIFLASVIGLIYWAILTLTSGYEKNRKVPFGTFLILSSIILFNISLNI